MVASQKTKRHKCSAVLCAVRLRLSEVRTTRCCCCCCCCCDFCVFCRSGFGVSRRALRFGARVLGRVLGPSGRPNVVREIRTTPHVCAARASQVSKLLSLFLSFSARAQYHCPRRRTLPLSHSAIGIIEGLGLSVLTLVRTVCQPNPLSGPWIGGGTTAAPASARSEHHAQSILYEKAHAGLTCTLALTPLMDALSLTLFP